MLYSVAVSDAVLAAVCLFGAFRFYPGRFELSAAPGFALVGLAACAGVARFAFVEDIAPVHRLLSTLAGQLGMPLVGFAFLLVSQHFTRNVQLGVIGALILLFVLFYTVLPVALYGTIVGGLAMIIVIVVGGVNFANNKEFAFLAILGGALVIFAGLGLRGEGELAGVLRVNWYHYALAVAMLCLQIALAKKI